MSGPFVVIRWGEQGWAQMLTLDETWTADQDDPRVAKLQTLELASMVVRAVDPSWRAFALPHEIGVLLLQKLEQDRKAGGR